MASLPSCVVAALVATLVLLCTPPLHQASSLTLADDALAGTTQTPTRPTATTVTEAFPYLLFVDREHISQADPRMTLRVQQPVKGPRVVTPTEPWEAWDIAAYNTVVAGTPGIRPHRLYYSCVEAPHGLPRLCLAESNDGVEWVKPSLGIYDFNNSTANNILLDAVGCTPFIEPHSHVVPDSERWKMVCSDATNKAVFVYASGDGVHWNPVLGKPLSNGDDTQPTGQWDASIGKYVIFMRRNIGAHDSGHRRHIGRCVTSNLSDWEQGVEAGAGGCPVVFGPDGKDPPNLDVYTSAHVAYPSAEHPSVHLFFPSMFSHFLGNDTHGGPPNGLSNDGLLDTKLLVAHDLTGNLTYPADGSREPFVHLGVNRCGAWTPDQNGGWCNPDDGSLAHTAVDTSSTWMITGFIPSTDGERLYLYYAGNPFTHAGGASTHHGWGNNTAISLLTLRTDGFVALEAPYDFSQPAPLLTTSVIRVPQGCSQGPGPGNTSLPGSRGPGDGGGRHAGASTGSTATATGTTRTLQLHINVITSVAGYVAVGVEAADGQPPPPGFAFDLHHAARIKGNALAAVASWVPSRTSRTSRAGGGGGAQVVSMTPWGGRLVRVNVEMVAAKLFSIRITCSP